MVSYPPSTSDRQSNGRTGAQNGHGKAERIPATPRKDGVAVKEKAVQDPGLKDYVRLRCLQTRDMCAYIIHLIASRRMFREGSFWISLQGIQLGYRGSCCCQADKAG